MHVPVTGGAHLCISTGPIVFSGVHLPKLKKSLILLVLTMASMAHATVFGRVKGLVHDPQHRPIRGAEVTVKAANSDLSLKTTTAAEGQFTLSGVPVGDYVVTVRRPVLQSFRKC